MRSVITFAILIAAAAIVGAAESPRIELYVGGGVAGSGPNYFVTLSHENALSVRWTGMPIAPGGKLTERSTTVEITPAQASDLLDLGKAASDFDQGCGKVADGTNARLIVASTEPIDRECHGAAEWPIGKHTKEFVEKVNALLPEGFQVH
jgi:hypothetical protein